MVRVAVFPGTYVGILRECPGRCTSRHPKMASLPKPATRWKYPFNIIQNLANPYTVRPVELHVWYNGDKVLLELPAFDAAGSAQHRNGKWEFAPFALRAYFRSRTDNALDTPAPPPPSSGPRGLPCLIPAATHDDFFCHSRLPQWVPGCAPGWFPPNQWR